MNQWQHYDSFQKRKLNQPPRFSKWALLRLFHASAWLRLPEVLGGLWQWQLRVMSLCCLCCWIVAGEHGILSILRWIIEDIILHSALRYLYPHRFAASTAAHDQTAFPGSPDCRTVTLTLLGLIESPCPGRTITCNHLRSTAPQEIRQWNCSPCLVWAAKSLKSPPFLWSSSNKKLQAGALQAFRDADSWKVSLEIVHPIYACSRNKIKSHVSHVP